MAPYRSARTGRGTHAAMRAVAHHYLNATRQLSPCRGTDKNALLSPQSYVHGPAPHPARTRPGRPSSMELALGPLSAWLAASAPAPLGAPRPPPACATRKRSGEFQTSTTRLPRRIDWELIWWVGMWGLAGKCGSAILPIPFPSSRAAAAATIALILMGYKGRRIALPWVRHPSARAALPSCVSMLQNVTLQDSLEGVTKLFLIYLFIYLFIFIYGIVNLESRIRHIEVNSNWSTPSEFSSENALKSE